MYAWCIPCYIFAPNVCLVYCFFHFHWGKNTDSSYWYRKHIFEWEYSMSLVFQSWHSRGSTLLQQVHFFLPNKHTLNKWYSTTRTTMSERSTEGRPISSHGMHIDILVWQKTIKQILETILYPLIMIISFIFMQSSTWQCTVMITAIQEGNNWWFPSCYNCNKSCVQQANTYQCRKCDCTRINFRLVIRLLSNP
jgi:hypothetical protein